MSELVLGPTLVFGEGGPDTTHSPWVVAPDEVSDQSLTAWSDGLDTTYGWATGIRTTRGSYQNWSDADPTIDASWITGVGVRFRAMSTDAGYFIVQLFGQPSKLLSTPPDLGVSVLHFDEQGVWTDFDYVVQDEDWDTTGWAPNRLQSALEQSSLYARTWPAANDHGTTLGDANIQISEQRIVIYYTQTVQESPFGSASELALPAPQRVHPRPGDAQRVYPRPRSRQGSNRAAGAVYN